MEGLSRGLDSRRERSGNIHSDLARASNAEKWPNCHSPSGCIENRPGAALDSQLQPAKGMRLRIRLARGLF